MVPFGFLMIMSNGFAVTQPCQTFIDILITSCCLLFLSGVPQGHVLYTLLLNIPNIFSLNDTKTFHATNSNNCTPVQSNIECVQGWCIATFMKLNISFHRNNKWF
jgi:hypothetical protein